MIQPKFTFNRLSGSRSIEGPVLTFNVKATCAGLGETTVNFLVEDGILNIRTKNGMMEVGQLRRPDSPLIVLQSGGEPSFELKIQLTQESFQRLLEECFDRTFQITIFATSPVELGALKTPTDAFLFVSTKQPHWVSGKIDEFENIQMFKVDTDTWLKAIESTRSASYVSDTVIVLSTELDYVRGLLAIVKEAEGFLNQGKVVEAIAKTRTIGEWAGYKKKGEVDRYNRLAGFSLSSDEKEGLKSVLDALWSWSSGGHHYDHDGTKSFSEEQAKMAIHLAYFIVSYLSRRELIAKEKAP